MTINEADSKQFTSQLAADIWGHRFKTSQRGPEYTLEFLNVICGSAYSFDSMEYVRKKSVGLREFIFEGMKEGSATNQVLVLDAERHERMQQALHAQDIAVLRQFLRSLEIIMYNTDGKEADRSWYAKSLYPLHESLLFVELRKKDNTTKDNKRKSAPSSERNFYARGGELYFLMLAHGTGQFGERRKFIERRFRHLLQKNKSIDRVVEKIKSIFEEKDTADNTMGSLRAPAKNGKLPLLPPGAEQENSGLFERFGAEMERLLLTELDIHEMFGLLTSLICFQLARYMHERSLTPSEKLIYFFDCLDGSNKQIVQQSANGFNKHESMLKRRFEEEFSRKAELAFGTREFIEQTLPEWKQEPKQFFKRMGIDSMHGRKEAIGKVLKKCNSADDVLGKLRDSLREAVGAQIDQLHITRVLSRDGGFATYRRGSANNYRYTISDSFLQMLVFTQVAPERPMEYSDFLQLLYQSYGIVIGEMQAVESGQYEQSGLNIRYFQDNERALREKLRINGLLIEFSDATAMVKNPYSSCVREVYQHG